jgi:predicted transposase YbfD/YdcC
MNPKTLPPTQLASLHEQIGRLPDCRRRRGIRHQYRTVLTLALAAVLCGARSFTALGEFAASLTQAQLNQLGCRYDPHRQRHQPPSESTLRRVLQASDAEALDRVLGQWLLAQADPHEPLAVDGKTGRGARRPDGSRLHLLSAFLHQQGTTVAQIEGGAKTNEIPELTRLLNPMDIPGRVVTVDARHTQPATARYLVEEKHAHYLMPVKENQHALRADLAALKPEDCSPGAHSV